MRFLFLFLLASVLLASCAPAVQPQTGEIIYQARDRETPSELQGLLKDVKSKAAIVVYANIAVCFIFHNRDNRMPPGYSDFDLSDESKSLTSSERGEFGFVFVGKQLSGSGSLKMTWLVKDAGWPYARVTLKTETNDPNLNVRDAEQRWFSCLDRYATPIASAR